MTIVQPIVKPNTDAMLAHLDHLFGGYLDGYHDGLIELSWTATMPDQNGKYALKYARLFGTDQLHELVEEAARLNSQPMCNVYIGAALRKPGTPPFGRASDDDAYALTCGYVDLDDPGAAGAAKDVYGKAKPTMIVVTGRDPHTRAQMWWRLEEPLGGPEAVAGAAQGHGCRHEGRQHGHEPGARHASCRQCGVARQGRAPRRRGDGHCAPQRARAKRLRVRAPRVAVPTDLDDRASTSGNDAHHKLARIAHGQDHGWSRSLHDAHDCGVPR
jgi:hypothetical protein